MYRWLFKRDMQRNLIYYAALLILITGIILFGGMIGLLIPGVKTNDTFWFMFTILIGVVLIIEFAAVQVGTYRMITPDLKASNYYLTRVKDFGIYINYKYFFNVVMIYIVLLLSAIVFIIFSLLLGEIEINFRESLSFFLSFIWICTMYFIVILFKFGLFSTVILDFILLLKMSYRRYALIFLFCGLGLWFIGCFFWYFNSWILFIIRAISMGFVLNYIAGIIINAKRKIK